MGDGVGRMSQGQNNELVCEKTEGWDEDDVGGRRRR